MILVFKVGLEVCYGLLFWHRGVWNFRRFRDVGFRDSDGIEAFGGCAKMFWGLCSSGPGVHSDMMISGGYRSDVPENSRVHG